MLAKKFALGFGIAIILPMMVHYGVSTFCPSPKWMDYHPYWVSSYDEEKGATPEKKAKIIEERRKRENAFRNAEKKFQQQLFIVAVPIGIVSIIWGSLNPIQAIGTGLMFGGIFTLIDGYANYWSGLEDWMRFISLVVAFIVLMFIGYRKLAK